MVTKTTRGQQQQASTPPPPPVPAPGTYKQVEVVTSEIYQAPIAAPELPQSSAPAIDIAARPVHNEAHSAGDDGDIDNFLSGLDREIRWVMGVDRLPDYQQTGKFGRRQAYAFMGEFPFSPDTYMLDVQRVCGAGDYRITLFGPRHVYKKRWVITIGQSGAEAGAAMGYPAPLAPAPPPLAQSDQLQTFLATARQLKELREIMGWAGPPGAQPVENNGHRSQSRPAAGDDEGQAPGEQLLIRLLGLAEKNPPLADRLLDRYLGKGEEENSWVGEIVELLKPAAPVIVSGLFQFLNRIIPQPAPIAGATAPGGPVFIPQPGGPVFVPPAPVFAGGPQSSAAAQSSRPQQPAPTAQHQAPGVEAAAPYLVPIDGENDMQEGDEPDGPQWGLIDRLVSMLDQAVRSNAIDAQAVEAAALDVVGMYQQQPDIRGMIDMMVGGPPSIVMGMLVMAYPEAHSLKSNPIAEQAIAALQARLREVGGAPPQ